MPFTDAVLQCLYTIIRKLYRSAAFGADQVIVVFVAENMLVVAVLLCRVHLSQKAALYQQGKSPVDTRPRYPDPPALQAEYDVIRLEMLVNAEYLPQDQLPFLRALQSLASHELAKHFFFGCFHKKPPPLI